MHEPDEFLRLVCILGGANPLTYSISSGYESRNRWRPAHRESVLPLRGASRGLGFPQSNLGLNAMRKRNLR